MARLDLGKVVSEIVEVKTTIDDNCGVPSVTASLSGTQTEKVLNLDFKNLKGKQGVDGAKPVKGVDYFTEEDKKEFTNGINGSITAEGQKQLQAITDKGTESLNAVKKVQTDIENILSNHGAEGNALSLNGKTGQQYDKEIQEVLGQCDGTFPLTKAEVNKVYLVPQTGKNYKCIKAYSGTQISVPNENFEDLSVLENRNRLSNLCRRTFILRLPELVIYETGMLYLITIQPRILISANTVKTINFNRNFDDMSICRTPISSTEIDNGRLGTSELVAVIENNQLAIHNQGSNKKDLYTSATTITIPKFKI